MKKLKNITHFIIPRYLFLLALLCLLPVFAYLFYKTTGVQNSSKGSQQLSKAVVKLASQVEQRWKLGDIEQAYSTDRFSCPAIPDAPDKLDPGFLRCNAEYFNCFLSGGIKGVSNEFSSGQYRLVALKEASSFLKSRGKGLYSMHFREQFSGQKLSVLLDSNCQEVELPRNIYSAGPESEQSLVWDNYQSRIFIDKYYRTNRQVKEWNPNHIFEKGQKYFPALNLSMEDREAYCQSQGRELLTSRVFDAATFYPINKVENYFFKYPYPWTKKRKVYLHLNKDITIQNCHKIYTLECRDLNIPIVTTKIGLSWTGLSHSLGTEMESFRNIENKRANLKVSSQYLAKNNFWHRNALRGFWNGEGFDNRDFEFLNQYNKDMFIEAVIPRGVAFRCMKVL